MSAETPAKARRELWEDWLPGDPPADAHLLTLPELLLRLRDRGVEVHDSDIRYWQGEGVLPYPVKRRHDKATRALYPPESVEVIRYLRQLQAEGHSLAESRWRLRVAARLLRETGKPLDDLNMDEVIRGVQRTAEQFARGISTMQESFSHVAATQQALEELGRSFHEMIVRGPERVRRQFQQLTQYLASARQELIAEEVHPPILEAAVRFSSFIGGKVTRVEVTFVDDHDQHHTLSVPVAVDLSYDLNPSPDTCNVDTDIAV